MNLHVCNLTITVCPSFRTSLQSWWRTCVFAQSNPALKMRGVFALKWFPHQSEFTSCTPACVCSSNGGEVALASHVCESVLQTAEVLVSCFSSVKWSLLCDFVCVGAVCCRQTQKGSSKHGSAPSKTASPQPFRSAERTRSAQ